MINRKISYQIIFQRLSYPLLVFGIICMTDYRKKGKKKVDYSISHRVPKLSDEFAADKLED